MTAGFYALSDYGSVQIDETYQNYVLTNRGTATVNGSVATYQSTTVSVTGYLPLIFWSGNVYCANTKIDKTGVSTWTFTLYVYMQAGNHSFPWFVFDQGSPTGSNSGAQIFGSSGQLVFDANARYQVIAGLWSLNASQSNNASAEVGVGLAGGRNYAVGNMGLCNSMNVAITPGGGPNTPSAVANIQYYTAMCRGTAGAIYYQNRNTGLTQYQITGGNSAPPTGFYGNGGMIMAVDVSFL